jgi:hypothetical protein
LTHGDSSPTGTTLAPPRGPLDQHATVAFRDNMAVGALDGTTADMVNAFARYEAGGSGEGLDERDDAYGDFVEAQSPFRGPNDEVDLAASAYPLPLAILELSD